jgi:hypothetical protein
MGFVCQKLCKSVLPVVGNPSRKVTDRRERFCYRCQLNKSQDMLKYSSRPSVLAVNMDLGTDHGCEAARAGAVRAAIYEGAG